MSRLRRHTSILDRIPDGHELATYNSEVARGLVHTEEWRRRMAVAQAAFDTIRRAEIDGVVAPQEDRHG